MKGASEPGRKRHLLPASNIGTPADKKENSGHSAREIFS
jgi:hypothetical protein